MFFDLSSILEAILVISFIFVATLYTFEHSIQYSLLRCSHLASLYSIFERIQIFIANKYKRYIGTLEYR